MDERVADNRDLWNDWAELHAKSAFYDLDGFRAKPNRLHPFEIEEVGSVEGKRLVHLQCHIGTDTIAWATLGAKVTGVDFSARSLEFARRLAADIGVDARFIEADVICAADAVGEQFDIVYTSWGTISWLPDLKAWADNVAALLTPGGLFYFADMHPVMESVDVVDGALQFSRPYGDGAHQSFENARSYTDREADTEHTTAHFFAHSVGKIATTLAEAGLTITSVVERPILTWQQNDLMVQGDDGYWRQPGCTLPLSLSVRARKP